jgi:hypothetical protein
MPNLRRVSNDSEPGSAGVSPAKLLEPIPQPFIIHTGGTPNAAYFLITHGDGVVTFLKENKVKVLFTTASYMDVDYGPHVSSSQNHALKRILNEYASVPGISRRNICVIAAENINRAVKDSQIAKNCKLIFDPEGREDILLYSQALAQDKQAWEEHLQNPNNYIIAGSNDEVKCLGVLDDFVKQHDLQLYRFSVDTGIIYQMSSLNG